MLKKCFVDTLGRIVVLFVIGLCFLFEIQAQVPSYVPSDGLVGWWPFNGNANDEWEGVLNGTATGATLTTDRHDNQNRAYSFDGDNDVISIGTVAGLPMASNSRSISVWMKPASIAGTWTLTAIAYGSPKTSEAFMFGLGISIISVQAWVDDYSAPLDYSANQWIHAVCTYDGTDVKVYIDGSLVGSGTNTTWNTTGTEFYFGGRVSLGNSFFHGKLDDIAVWNRVLTATEVSALYESPTITSQPSGSAIAGGQQTTMSVSASAATTMTYQWQRNDGSGFANISDGAEYSGSTSATLTIKSAKRSKAGPYRCVVSTTNASVNSNGATLTVTCPCNE